MVPTETTASTSCDAISGMRTGEPTLDRTPPRRLEPDEFSTGPVLHSDLDDYRLEAWPRLGNTSTASVGDASNSAMAGAASRSTSATVAVGWLPTRSQTTF